MKAFRLRAKSHQRPSRAVIALVGLTMLVVGPAYADFVPGDQFLYNWTEITGSQPGLTGKVDFTLGPASTTTGFFTLSSFDVVGGGLCGICTNVPLTENLSGALFDAATLGVVGSITGEFYNKNNTVHTYDLTSTDLPAGTWTFVDTSPGGSSKTSTGTYTISPSTTADLPATGILLLSGLAGVALISLRRRPGC